MKTFKKALVIIGIFALIGGISTLSAQSKQADDFQTYNHSVTENHYMRKWRRHCQRIMAQWNEDNTHNHHYGHKNHAHRFMKR